MALLLDGWASVALHKSAHAFVLLNLKVATELRTCKLRDCVSLEAMGIPTQKTVSVWPLARRY